MSDSSDAPSAEVPSLTGDQGREAGLDDAVKQYLDSIGEYRRLTREEEIELSEVVRHGTPEESKEAQDVLVEHNLRLVVWIAKDFTRGRFDILELVSPGNEGLMIAAKKFDGSKGVPFANYAAYWIKQRIMKYSTEHGFPVRVPPYRSAIINKVTRVHSQLREALGREPSADEIAEETGNDPDEIEEVLQILQPALQLDAPLEEEGDGTTHRTYFSDEDRADTRDRVRDALSSIDREQAVRRALSLLDDRDAKVLEWYFGLNGHRPLDLAQIGARLGVSRERARQIRHEALQKLEDEGSLAIYHDG